MNKRELGLKFELKAIERLKLLGFEIIEHTSQVRKIAPYDITAKKDNKLFYIEVKGRSGGSNSFRINRQQCMAYVYFENVWFFLVNDKEYRFIKLEECQNKSKLNGFVLHFGCGLYEIEKLRKKFNEEMSLRNSLDFALVRKLGEQYIVFLHKDTVNFHNIIDGCCINISDMYKCEVKR